MTATPADALYAFRNNMVVTASAGTGKTFRLVTLYTLLTLGLTSRGENDETRAAAPVLPSRIAATTFSRAAAAEIRERVERVLSAVASAQYDASTDAYRAIFEMRATQTGSPSVTSRALRERARAALDDLPHALIDTLHGLAGRIVRGSALELGMSPGFAILEEEQARVSTDAIIEEVLSGALSRGDAGATHLLDAGGGLAMTRLRVAELLDRVDEEGVGIEELASTDFAPVARETMARLGSICRDLVTEGSKGFAEAAAPVSRLAETWARGENAYEEESLRLLLEPLFTKRSPARPSPAEEAFLTFRETVRGDTNGDRARRLAAFLVAAADLRPRALALSAVVLEIARRRSQARQQAGTIGFGDLLRLARNALRDRLDIARTQGAMFDVLLVDEFQDTSRVQRDLIYLLRESRESVARRTAGEMPKATELESTGLLIVGDRKQSIYGFRGADVTVFTRVAAELAGRSAAEALCLGSDFDWPEQTNASLISLWENRRSHSAILEFVNWFAQHDFGAGSPYPFDIVYAESEHLRPPALASSPVHDDDFPRVVVVEDDRETLPELPPLVRAASGPMREAIVAAAVVERAVREGAFGPLAFGDVAILARRRATLPLLEFALSRLDIPFVVAGRGLFDTREVRDIFGVLRLVLDPFDRHALAVVLRGPALALRDSSLALLSSPGRGLTPPSDWFRSGGLAARLPADEQGRLERFAARFSELRAICLGLGPADAIRYAIQKLELDYVFSALPRAPQRLGNLERLIALASRRGGSLPSFVRWLERQISDQSDESEAAVLSPGDDAVTLMTIHASKGLEFPAVLLVDMGAAVRAPPLSLALAPARRELPPRLVMRHTKPDGSSLFTPEAVAYGREATAREVAERRRLTYVAMTRARDRLFLLLPPTAPNGSASATLKALLPEVPEKCGRALVESAAPYLARAPHDEKPTAQAGPLLASTGPQTTDRGAISISTTPFSTFDQCPRRYRFIHEMGIEPPPFLGTVAQSSRTRDREESRAVGTAAHRILERWPLARWGKETASEEILALLAGEGLAATNEESRTMSEGLARFLGGPYAARVKDGASHVFREEPFVVEIARPEGVLSLRGTIDLLIAFEDGSADVIDYKSSWNPDVADHGFQLRAYALAARRRFGLSPVRAAIVDLTGGPAPVVIETLDDAALDAFENHLAALRGQFMTARSSDDFPGIAGPACEARRCGFIRVCHDQDARRVTVSDADLSRGRRLPLRET